MKKLHKGMLITIFILMLIAMVIAIFYFVFNSNREVMEVEVIDSIEGYDYSLSNLDSDYYRDEFYNLKDILSTDTNRESYIKQVAKLFIIDLYTLDTKINKYDVGGIDFYHKDKVSMFNSKVSDTFYNTIVDNTYGDREQDLPVVKDVIVGSYDVSEYLLGDTEVKSYIVTLNWSYESDMGYDTSSVVTIVDNDKKVEVVALEAIEKDTLS